MTAAREAKLKAILSELGVPDAARKAHLMLGYMKLVLKRNEVMNLTAITDEDEFIEKHIADSLAAYGRPEFIVARRVADIGTGAGFPGVPLAIACPEKAFLLIDSLRKRTDFITEACAELGIDDVQVLQARAEEAARAPLRESFDLVVSRAVGHLSTLCEYGLPLARVGGALYAYKSARQVNEIEESENARQILGAAPVAEVLTRAATPPRQPGLETAEDSVRTASIAAPTANAHQAPAAHIIIVIRKERPTPAAYPRRAGIPAKRPLHARLDSL
ncbi:MAG: 16S rRNA (guanine(527)-N(7))-methyltransferase RsmG [Clostridiales Family XIII bacterium]|jgi:16S rRNA (guanine527-N7)-methyltransferase|nr:16S rRNA (guanine(527)-N(7))-methyltransferase RsmG [Clostridiales Family XIII bacterium]